MLLSKSSPRKPVKLQTDKGLEFTNSELNKFLEQQGIHRFSSESDQKAAGAERFNRTIKTKIETAINTHQDERWVDRLDQYLESYKRLAGVGRLKLELRKMQFERTEMTGIQRRLQQAFAFG